MPACFEMFRAIGAMCEPPDPAHARLAAALGLPPPPDAAAFTEVFVFQHVPYAAPYLSPDGMLGGEAGDRVAGFWRAIGITLPAEPDHLATLLDLYAALSEREHAERRAARKAAWHDARRTLLWDHLLTWVPAYAAAMTALPAGFHAMWARLLRDALLGEARALEPPPGTPLHMRDVPSLPDTADDGFVRALLAPVRSGILITRHDLASAAADIGTGTRIGGRAFILRALISQHRAATHRWLAQRARWWEEQHRAADPPLTCIARHWQARAHTTLALLDQATPGRSTLDQTMRSDYDN